MGMKYICLIGPNEELKQLLAKALAKKGFRVNKPFVQTDERIDPEIYKTVSQQKFNELVEKGVIMLVENFGGRKYGTAEPFGSSRYVGIDTNNGYKALKAKYGRQVKTVYVCDEEDSETDGYDMVLVGLSRLSSVVENIIQEV